MSSNTPTVAPAALIAFAKAQGLALPSIAEEPDRLVRKAFHDAATAAYLASLPPEVVAATTEEKERKATEHKEYVYFLLTSEDSRFVQCTVYVIGRGLTVGETSIALLKDCADEAAKLEDTGLFVRPQRILVSEWEGGITPRKNAAKG